MNSITLFCLERDARSGLTAAIQGRRQPTGWEADQAHRAIDELRAADLHHEADELVAHYLTARRMPRTADTDLALAHLELAHAVMTGYLPLFAKDTLQAEIQRYAGTLYAETIADRMAQIDAMLCTTLPTIGIAQGDHYEARH